MDQGARFPRVAAKAGHYESFYVKACRPGGGQGIWIRHTVHKRPGEEPNASIWFTFFDRDGGAPRAGKVTVPEAELTVPTGAWIRVGEAQMCGGKLSGSVRTDALSATWEMTIGGDLDPCKYLPADWLYEAPLPKTKFVAPIPNARFDGRVELDGETIEVAGWPGMVGHNWGSEHAERWVWLEGTGFPDAPDDYFDCGAARIKIGSRVTPWIPSGMLRLDGQTHRLGGFGKIRSSTIEEDYGSCSFVLPGKDIVVRGRVSAPLEQFVGWVYADPKGPEHNTINCSVADLELTVERPGKPVRELRLPAGAAYELGMRETGHGVPIQPFADG